MCCIIYSGFVLPWCCLMAHRAYRGLNDGEGKAVFLLPIMPIKTVQIKMAQIEIFKNESFVEVRVAGTSEEPLFCASDLCRALGYVNGRDAVSKHVDEGDVAKCDTPTLSGIQQMTYVNESGLYALIFGSKQQNAKAFKKWVTTEVLPSIRKTGTYSVQQQFQLPQTYLEALKALVASEEEKQQLAIENKVMRPKAEYFDKLIDRNLLTNIRDTAKQIHIPQNRFVKWLLDKRFVYRDAKRKLKPYAEYIPEYFELKDFERNGHADTQLLINPKGKETFRLMIAGE